MAGVRQFNESTVLTKALDVFWEKGYQGTSMIDLSKATGVQRGSLYNAFGSKASLFTSAFEHYSDQLIQDVEASLKHPDIETALSNMFAFFSRRLCSDEKSRGCLTTKTIMESRTEDSLVHEQLKTLINRLELTIKNRLDIAKKKQTFSGDSLKTARYLVALSRGLAVIERIYYDESRIQEIYCDAIKMLSFNGK